MPYLELAPPDWSALPGGTREAAWIADRNRKFGLSAEPKRQRIRFGGRITCEFISGGDRPDIIIFLDRVTIAVGEIKGRKDLSNVWESWMPGVYNHTRTWTGQNPDAARLFFGTLINEAMLEGSSSHGTQHVGLKTLWRQGLLTAAYNVSKVAENDHLAVQQFQGLVDALDLLIER